MRAEIRLINKYITFLIFALGISWGQVCYSQSKILPGLYKSEKNNFEFEINEIRFQGNETFQAKDLSKAILSKISSRNPIHTINQYYYDNLKRIDNAPKTIVRLLKNNLKSYEKELRYFNEKTANNDTSSLVNFYNKNGFHNTTAYYEFKPDSSTKQNVLTYFIKENKRTPIGSINYIGFDKLDDETKRKVLDLRIIKAGDFFSEDNITAEMLSIQTLLLDNGYFYTKISKPVVYEDYLGNDSVIVNINVGKRQRIGEIVFEDDLRGQKYITNEFKKEQLDFNKGDIYSRSLLIRSQDNLKSLGIFDVVKIDTLPRTDLKNDTVINFKISSQYTNQQDWGIGLFANQFANPDVNEMFNAGFQIDYGHKNIFGIAQQFRPFAKVYIRDINNRPFDKIERGEIELQLGFRFAQPSIFQIDKARVGLDMSPVYSIRTINNIFTLRTASLPIRFPIKLPDFTIFRSAIFDVTLDRQHPVDYDKSIEKANLPKDSAQRYEILYRNLNDYLNDGSFHLLTSSLFGLTFIGDKRNHPFSPTDGYYISLFGESYNFIGGLAKYYKGQITLYKYMSVAENSVLAFKLRAGSIGFLDPDNKYIPVERQYFAGGANGNRGFVARRLRYSTATAASLGGNTSFDFLQEFVGNSTLIESTIEFRLRFKAPENYDELVAYNINASGVVAFLDFGNAFGWFVPNDTTKVDFTKIAASAGFGYRYDTPLGPVRLDIAWPVLDPLKDPIRLSRYQFHLALGHAF